MLEVPLEIRYAVGMISVVMLVVQSLMILLFASASLLKLVGHPHMRKEFANFDYPYWLALLAGAIELAATGLLLAGFFEPVLAGVAGLILLPVMIGATYTNFVKRPPAFGWGMLVIVATCGATALYHLRPIVVPWIL